MNLLGRLPVASNRRNGRWALLAVLAAATVTEASLYASEAAFVAPAALLNLAVVSQLAVVRRFPLLASVAATLATTVIIADMHMPLTASGLLCLLGIDALLVMRRGLGLALLLAFPFALNAVVPLDGRDAGAASFGPLVLVVASLLVGEAMRQRGSAIEERDASQAALADTMREQAVMEERARIARELHDIVAHHVSAISVRAEAARVTSPALSADGRKRFEEIGEAAREALTEMSRLLGVLRDDAGSGADRTPQPGLDQLAELLSTARAGGANIRLVLQGEAVELPAGVDLTAYRIVQEALTNTRRHAPGADVDVEIDYHPDMIHLRIRDMGRGPADQPVTEGHGLIGLRDRAAMVGGTFRYGRADDGGFTVEAELPLVAAQ